MTQDREGAEPRGDADGGLDALPVERRPVPAWVKGLATIMGLILWLVLSMFFLYDLVLAPLGCLIVVVLLVRAWRGAPVGGQLAAAVVGTAWSLLVLGAVLVWSPSTPAVSTVPGRPEDLTVEQQMAIDRSELEFYDVAYRVRDLDAYRRHVVGRPGRDQLAGCWDGTAQLAESGSREFRERSPLDDHTVIDVDLGFAVDDVIYHARLEVTLDDWQVVELDRLPGFESCPMGFPLPPAPARPPPGTG